MDVSTGLLHFCGIPWDAQTEKFILQSTGRQQSRYYSDFKNPMQSHFDGKRSLPPPIVEEVMHTVSDTQPGKLYLDLD
jgi:hypothetical protein